MKSQPKVPDAAKVSAAQTQSNVDTAKANAALNRIDQSSPFGSVQYSTNGIDPATGMPQYSQNTTLSPQMQGLFDKQIGAQGGISDAITGAIGRLPSGAFDASGINTDNIAKASYDKGVAQMQPQWDQAWKNLEVQMSDRGIPIGSAISNDERNRYDTAHDTSLSQISRQSQLDAGTEAQRQYNNKMAEYGLPMSQLSALMGNSSAVGSPQFSSVPQAGVAPTNTAQNEWNAYSQNSQNATNANNQMFNGLLGLGSMAANPASVFGYKMWG